MHSEHKTGIYAVVPTMRKSVSDVISNLLSQDKSPDKIVVVDNGVGLHIDESEKVKVIQLKENMGSEGGYYAGMKYALAKDDCKFIFTSDDDTEYERNAVGELLFWLKNLPQAGACRCAWEGYTGDVAEVKSSIWSGVLMKKEAVRKTGLPKKEFFIYCGDEEFFTRMRKKGYKIYIIPTARYKKRERGERRREGKKEVYSTPFRVYYAFRNEVALGIERQNPLRVLRVLLYFFKVFPIMPADCRKAGIEGITDGLRRKLGKNAKYIPDGEKIVRK